MASHSQSTCEALRSLVRSSSNCRCGRRRWQKKRSCRVCACSPAREGGNGGLSKAEDPLGSRRIQPFGRRREHHCDLLGRGFQTVQEGVASGSEGGAASETSKRLDALEMAMLAIARKPHEYEPR